MDKVEMVGVDELNLLKAGIKSKYKAYHALDRDKFPDFDYNTNRANYEPLRASFEQELYVERSLDGTNPAIHIPSTTTLALLFTDDSYIPNRKILNACHLYAAARPNSVTKPDSEPQITNRKRLRWLWSLSIGFIAIVGYSIFGMNQANKKVMASGLVVQYPKQGQVVSRLVHIAGKVTNADKVWLVVHPIDKGEKFYVQSPIVVDESGKWSGIILAGTRFDGFEDYYFDVRAFVNPGGSYKAIEEQGTIVFNSWPEEAELASESVIIIRRPKMK